MIYINTNQTISIPRHSMNDSKTYSLQIQSRMTDPIIIVENQNDISTNAFYYEFPLSLPETLYEGEYTYILVTEDGQVVETGLLSYGEYSRLGVVSNHSPINKIQYNG